MSRTRTITCVQTENAALADYLQSQIDGESDPRSRQASTLRRALRGIQAHTSVLYSAKQTRKEIKGVGPVLEGKLNAFFSSPSAPQGQENTTNIPAPSPAPRAGRTNPEITNKEPTPQIYVPRVDSAPWNILKAFAMLGDLHMRREKEEIVEVLASTDANSSKMSRGLTSLVSRGLLVRSSNKYQLSSAGIAAALKVKPSARATARPIRPVDSVPTARADQETVGRTPLSRIDRVERSREGSIQRRMRRLSLEPEQPEESAPSTEPTTLVRNGAHSAVAPSPAETTGNQPTGDLQFQKILLVIDTREMQFQGTSGRKKSFLKEKLDELGVVNETRNLSVGDMVWVGVTPEKEEHVLEYVVERKAIDDLCSSIIDGRYVEQKYRLMRSSFTKVLYLLEGDTNRMGNRNGGHHSQFTAHTLQKALCSTQVGAQFHTHQTRDLQDTAQFLARMTRMIKRKYAYHATQNPCKFSSELFPTFKNYMDNNAKTGDLTVQDLFAKQLLQINGCSPERVFAILEDYPTLVDLRNAYLALDDEKARQKMLASIVCGEKQRRLGPVLSKRICAAYTTQ